MLKSTQWLVVWRTFSGCQVRKKFIHWCKSSFWRFTCVLMYSLFKLFFQVYSAEKKKKTCILEFPSLFPLSRSFEHNLFVHFRWSVKSRPLEDILSSAVSIQWHHYVTENVQFLVLLSRYLLFVCPLTQQESVLSAWKAARRTDEDVLFWCGATGSGFFVLKRKKVTTVNTHV